MAEPSPCLLRSFSHPSDSSREATESFQGHIAHALRGSVSFGRFMSETLDWEKYSTFSQDRYLEEAEKCLRPGLVAQKKAYFEDYFKNIAARKAAALVEEATRETTDVAEKPLTDTDFAKAKLHLPVYEGPNIDIDVTSSPSCLDVSRCDFNVEDDESKKGRLEGLEIVEERQVCVESSSKVENVDIYEGNVLVKESDNEDIVDSANKKKRRVLSPNSIMHDRVPKIPLPPAIKTTLRPLAVLSNAAIACKKAAGHSTARKRLASTSINFSSSCKKRTDTSQTYIRASVYETSKDSSKPSRILKRASDHEASKDSSKILRTRASVCGTSGHNSNTSQPLRASLSIATKRPSVTVKSEDRRTKQLNKLVSVPTTGTSVSKWYSQSVDLSKSMNAGGKKSGSTSTKAIPFSLRSDERAAKRKKFKKIDEKNDAREAEKEQLQKKSKRKIEDSWAKPSNDAPRVRPVPNNHLMKITPPKPGRTPAPSVQDKSGRTQVKSSMSGSSNSKHALKKGHKTTSFAKKNASENASPNIQN